jgi:hypothetical protein
VLIKTEDEVSNTLDIVRVNQRGGEQFYISPSLSVAGPAAFLSIAEQTLDCYSDDTTKKSDEGKKMECFGSGGPHAWSKNFCST